jgi:hypothetical protein
VRSHPTITASYGGGATLGPSSGSQTLTVTPRATAMTFSCAQTHVAVGEQTGCTVTVTDVSPGSPSSPTGTISFSGHENDGFAPNPCTLASNGQLGQASCQTTYTVLGSGLAQRTLTARYTGNVTHSGSSATTVENVP